MTPLSELEPERIAALTVLQRLIARLVFERHKLSRNRSFEAFDDPDVQRAVRLARHLGSVIGDLRDPAVGVSTSADPRRPGELRLVFTFVERDTRRTAWLTADELAVLRLDDEAWSRLSPTSQ